jgi:uncharacterized membrane protein YbhN (UPF0104 family)
MTIGTAVQGTSSSDGRSSSPGRSSVGTWLRRLAVLGVLAAATVRALHLGDLGRALEIVHGAGWSVLAVLLPTGITMSLDARGWALVLRTVGARVRWRVLLPIRLASESVVLAIPGGGIAAEAAKLAFLKSGAGVALGIGGASLGVCKALHIGGEAVYLTVAAIAVSVSGASVGAHQLLPPWLLAGAGALIVGCTSLSLFLLMRDVDRVFSFFRRRFPWRSERVGSWLEARHASFARLGEAARGFFGAPASTRLLCFVPFALEWFVEGFETWLILRCLGAHVGLASAIVVDGVGSLLRALAFFVPAGLGVQDAAEVALLAMLGVPDATVTGMALIFVKRSKEVFWLFTGLGIGAAKRELWSNTQLERAG